MPRLDNSTKKQRDYRLSELRREALEALAAAERLDKAIRAALAAGVSLKAVSRIPGTASYPTLRRRYGQGAPGAEVGTQQGTQQL